MPDKPDLHSMYGICCVGRKTGDNIPVHATTYLDWEENVITVVSGACDTVMPAEVCNDINIEDCQAIREGVVCDTADGDVHLPNLGQRRCPMMTLGVKGSRKVLFQGGDIHKPLLSVSNVCGAGFECRSGNAGCVLWDLNTKDQIPIIRRNNLYTMRPWVKHDRPAGFPGRIDDR